jgi:hypothetical protein
MVSTRPSAAGGVCLNMIVKNEAAKTERCLCRGGARNSRWVICDMAFTDDTAGRVERSSANATSRARPTTFHSSTSSTPETTRSTGRVALACL